MGALGLSFGSTRENFRSSAREVSPATWVLVLIVVGSLVRIAMAGATGLGTDESYTVANARHFAWSYVDYPPLHVWLVGAWSKLTGSEAPLVVRLPSIACFAGSTWMMFRLASFLFDEATGAWAALLLNLAPVFTLAHASWVLPDGPLIFLMLSCAGVVAKLLFAEDRPSRSLTGWALAGALAGLAMITKYHGAFLLAAVFVFLATWKKGRELLKTPAPWLGAAVAVLIFWPVIIWNMNHDGSGLFFQANRLAVPKPSFSRVLAAIAEQSLYLAPWLFVPLATSWIAALIKGPSQPRTWFLALLASGPIVVFTSANFIARGLPHWPMPGWLFAFPLLGALAAHFVQIRPKLIKRSCTASAGVLLAFALLVGTEANSGWITDHFPAQDERLDPTLDLLAWSELKSSFADRNLVNDATPAVAALNWIEAGKLNYAVGKDIPVLCICVDPQQFRYQGNPNSFVGRNILIVGTPKNIASSQVRLSVLFEHLDPLPPTILHRAGRPAVILQLIRGSGFRAERLSMLASRAGSNVSQQ